MKNHILKTLVLFCLPFCLSAQAIYNGHVRDVATQKTISGVNISLSSNNVETTSNVFGNFLIKNTETDSLLYPSNSYRFQNNSMIWEGESDISLEIFSIGGYIVNKQANLGNSGHYLFPNFPTGVYVLRIVTESGTQSFRAFSNGLRTVIADKEAVWHHSSVPTKQDTLLLSKEGYYPRSIPLYGRDTLLTVSLLKKENEEIHYFNELIDPAAFELISSLPSRSHDGRVASVKIMRNTDNGLMYYMNTKLYKLHSTFAKEQLGFNKGNNVFNQTQYREHPDRFLYPANLNYYKDLDKYVLYIVSANEISCEKIKLLYDNIVATSYLENNLFLYANRLEFNDCDVPLITSEELYKGQNYQALNLAENYGYLTKVALEDLEETYLSRRDIVLLNGIPNDVSVVAGIITTEFQTPLSHINVLSHNRGTPNMALRDGWENEQLEKLLGELVYLKVESDSFQIRKATLEEATIFWQQNEPQEVIELEKNTEAQGLVDLDLANHTYLDIIGGKAANFAELLNVKLLNGTPIPTPEGNAFAIPFYYYAQHLKKAGLENFIVEMLQDEDFLQSAAVRRLRLENLQDRIEDFPLDADLVDMVRDKIKNFGEFESFRFRSSTNAEDLEGFSGAGLYSSYSAKKNHSKKTIERAIKKVWASLWNWRAFEERSYYKIVHTSCAMGILVHRSFPDEDANGVLITKNLYNTNPGFIINVQFKEYSIVFPEPDILHDQIILMLWSIIPDQSFMTEYLTFSNIPELEGETVMTDAELMELGEYALATRRHFYRNVPHNCNCSEQDFGLDIEFKVDSQVENRKIYLKQARFYK